MEALKKNNAGTAVPAHLRLEALALLNDLMHDGHVNYSAFSKRTGISASTIMRVCRKKDPNHQFGLTTLSALVEAFDITMDQAMGITAIGAAEEQVSAEQTDALLQDPSVRKMLTSLARLDDSVKRDVSRYVQEQAKLQAITACERCGTPLEHLGTRDVEDDNGVLVDAQCYFCPACAETGRAKGIVDRLKKLDSEA